MVVCRGSVGSAQLVLLEALFSIGMLLPVSTDLPRGRALFAQPGDEMLRNDFPLFSLPVKKAIFLKFTFPHYTEVFIRTFPQFLSSEAYVQM